LRCPRCQTLVLLSFDAKMGERYYCPTCQEWYKPNFTEERPAGVA